jgi:hypothetical protein
MERLQRDEENAYFTFEKALDYNIRDESLRAKAEAYRAAGDALAHAYVTEIHRIERTQSEVADNTAGALGDRE